MCATLVVFMLGILLSAFAPAAPAAGLLPGSTAPSFVRSDLSGRHVTLGNFRGKVVLLDFWATWCAPCISETPRLIALQKRYGPDGLRVIGIAMDDSATPVVAFSKRFAFNYPLLMGDANLGEAYGVYGFPARIVIAPDGRIEDVLKGELAPDVLERSVRSALRKR